MQKLLFVKGSKLDEVNNLIEEGWEVKSVNPVAEHVSTGSCNPIFGDVCAYVLLEKN